MTILTLGPEKGPEGEKAATEEKAPEPIAPAPEPVPVEVKNPRRSCSIAIAVFLALVIIGALVGLGLWFGLGKNRKHGFCNVRYIDGKRYKNYTENVDVKSPTCQVMEVPKLGAWHRARFIHDFDVNKTAIHDIDNRVCFVMQLNRSVVPPPKNFTDFFEKFQEGVYNVNATVVSRTMHVTRGPLTWDQLRRYGNYIPYECVYVDTFDIAPGKSRHHRITEQRFFDMGIDYHIHRH